MQNTLLVSIDLHYAFHSIIIVMSELFMKSGKPSMTLSVSLATKEFLLNNTKWNMKYNVSGL